MPRSTALKTRSASGVKAGRVAPITLTQLDIAILAAGATRHRADHALRRKLVAAGLLRQNPRTGSFELTERARKLLEQNGYTFDPKLGWCLDIARAARALQAR
ncbi:hypothetical protein VVD49_19175 [Uliginosibacterium sp. H3]|uniref:Restriction system protein Mrr-like N-terminal domain-containing protein n=1 Tax=Uliginosibacterium silvisoli TaxID=3114758 RepID=A0ABU6K7S4_9RHOO|nr:hypothetical protein [Uliginosibacterium sp. H3]